MEAMKLKRAASDDRETFINAVKLLAHDPGDKGTMLVVAQAAQKAGFYDAAMWYAVSWAEGVR